MYRNALSFAVVIMMFMLVTLGSAHADSSKSTLDNLPGANNAAGQADPRAVVTYQEEESWFFDLDMAGIPGSNSAAGQQSPDAVIKEYAAPLWRAEGFASNPFYGPWPATTDYAGIVGVTAGKPYALDVFWCDKDRPFYTVPKPDWARTRIVGISNVMIRPDGKFVAKGEGGFVLLYFWKADKPWIRWAMSVQVYVKGPKRPKGSYSLDDIGPKPTHDINDI